MKLMPDDSYVPNVLYNTNAINISNPAKGFCICIVTEGSTKLRLHTALGLCSTPASPDERSQLGILGSKTRSKDDIF